MKQPLRAPTIKKARNAKTARGKASPMERLIALARRAPAHRRERENQGQEERAEHRAERTQRDDTV